MTRQSYVLNSKGECAVILQYSKKLMDIQHIIINMYTEDS